MSTKYPGGFISSIEPTVSPLSAKGIWTLAEALRYKTAGEWPVSPTYVAIQGVFATANVGQAESVIPVLLTGLQATGSVNDLTVIGSAIVALDTVSGTGGIGQVSISLPVVFDEYFNLNSMLLADSLANTFITDEGPNKFVITPNGDTRPSAFSPYNGGWSNYFDGTGDYLSIANSADLDQSGDFTQEVWYCRTGDGQGSIDVIFIKNITNFAYISVVQSTGIVEVNKHNVGALITGTTATAIGQWYHLAVTRSGSDLRLFVNGVQEGSTVTYSTNTTGNAVSYIGGFPAAHSTAGYFSNLRVIAGTALYTTTFTPPTAPLTAITNTSLLTCQSNRFVDNSTNNFTLTKNGDVKVTSFGPFSTDYRATPESYSVYFDGTGDYLSVADNTALDLEDSDFCLEAWIYQFGTTATNGMRLFNKYTYSARDYGYVLDINQVSAPKIRALAFNSSGGAIINFSSTSSELLANAWNHIAWVRSGSNSSLYVNGTRVATSSSVSGSIENTALPLDIGSQAGTTGTFFTGHISNARIVKGSAVYDPTQTTIAVPTSPLTAIANTSLLTCQSPTVIDNSSNGFAITTVGQAQPVTANPFDGSPITYSGYFANSQLSLSANTAFDFGTGDFTIEGWFYTTKAEDGSNPINIAVYIGTVNGASALGLGVAASAIRVRVGSNILSITSLSLSSWTHIAFVRSSGVLYVYVGGSLAGSVNLTTNLSSTGGIIIARQSTTYSFYGGISNLRMVKGTAVYTFAFDPPTAPLEAITGTSLLTCQSPAFIDNSSNAFTLTQGNNPLIKTDNPLGYNEITQTAITDTTGSGYFDGTGDYLVTPSSAAFAFGTGNFTVEAWVYLVGTNYCEVFTTATGSFPTTAMRLLVTNSQKLQYYDGTNAATSTASIALNTWTHVAVVREGTGANQTKLYINGSQDGTTTSSNNLTNSTGYIGKTWDGISFAGYISNARIVKGRAVYTSAFTPPTAPLTAIANTSLLTLQHRVSYNNSQPIDTSGIKNVLTRNGNASVGSYSPFTPNGWSGYFDGTGDSLSVPGTTEFQFGTGDFTVEAFVYLNSVSTGDAQYFASTYDGANGGWAFYSPSGSTSLAFRNGDAGIVTRSYTFLPGTWYHLAVLRSSSTLKFFVDGTQIGSDENSYTQNITRNNSNGLSIGRYATSINQFGAYVNGYVSNLRVIKGTAVTPPSGGPTAPLEPIAGTSLLTLRGPSFTDDGPNRLAITRNGDTKITASSPFAPNTITPDSYSVYFDGTGDYLTTPIASSSISSSTSFTIEFWAYWRVLPASYSMFLSDSNGNLSKYIAYNAGAGTLDVQTGGSAPTVAYASFSPVVNTWYHLAFVRNGTTITIYVNGSALSMVQPTQANAILDSGSTTYIGRWAGTTPFEMNGYISNLRIVKGTAIVPPSGGPTSPLTAVAGTSLLICQSPTFVDNSPNNFAGSVFGNTQPSTFNPFGETVTTGVEYSPATHGGSVYFDGTGDYLGTNYSINWSTLGAYTIEFWVYHASLSASNQTYLSTGSTGYTNFYNYSDGRVGLGIQGTNEITTASGAIIANTWHHIAYTYDGTTTRIYIDGVLRASGTTAVYSNNTAALQIANGLSTQPVFGYMSSVRIVRGTALYTAAFVPPQAPVAPTPATTLLTCGNNAAIYDYTGKNVLETVGNARTVQETPYRDNHSVYFDGTGDELETASAIVSSTEYSIEAWVYATINQQGYIAAQYTAGNGSRTVFLYRESNTNLYFFHPNVGSVGAIPLALGTWYHVTLTRDSGGRTRMFVDGVLKHTFTTSYTPEASSFSIGGNGESGSNFGGYISNMRVLNGGIPPSYQTTSTTIDAQIFTPPTSPLTDITNTVLLTCNTYNFTDSSSTPLTLTVSGGARISSRGPFQQNEGDRCMYFDGTGDYLVTSDYLDYNFGAGNFTIEMWVNFSASVSGAGYFLLARGPAAFNVNAGWTLWRSTSNTLRFIFSTDGTVNNYYYTDIAFTPTTGVWYHIAVTRNGSTFKMFIDGDSKTITTGSTGTGSASSAIFNSTRPLHIGASSDVQAGTQFNGYIDDLRITKGVARYTINFDPPSEPLPKA